MKNALLAVLIGACISQMATDRAFAAEEPAVAAQSAAFSEQFLDVAGARVRVRTEGPADAPLLVMVHGFTFSLESWDAWAADLRQDYRIVRYDLLGHGLSGPDPQQRYSPDERVAFHHLLMQQLGIKHATLIGNSFGGLLAWRYAVAHPEAVERLILVDAAAYSINGVTDKPVPVPDFMRAYLTSVPEAGLRASLARVYSDISRLTPDRFDTIRKMMTQPGNGDALIGHLEKFTLPDPEADLEKIAVPTLILWGDKDAVIPVEQAHRMAAAIKGSQLQVYENVGHAPQEEAPERTLPDVRAFLATTAQK